MDELFDGFPLIPRDGHTLQVLIVARISTVHQDERSLDDQAALCRKYVQDRYSAAVNFRVIQGRGSGELLDRQELRDAEDAVISCEFDLLIVEDLGRVCRRSHANIFVEACEDAKTRFIAINDSIDTACDNWQMPAFVANFKHESSNRDTSKRIRRSLRNRFVQGGVVTTFPYGYIKAPGAKSDAELTKDPAAVSIYHHWFQMLEDGATFAEVANWLNDNNVPTGPWMRQERWQGSSVGKVTRNTILKGVRRRNWRVSARKNFTGRRLTIKANPEEHLERSVPHLAFFDPERYDRVLAMVNDRNSAISHGHAASKRVARKRSTWPGQHVLCGVCGSAYQWGGNGMTDSMMCTGAKELRCWNGSALNGLEVAKLLGSRLSTFVERMPEFDHDFRARAEAAVKAQHAEHDTDLDRINAERSKAEKIVANLVDAVATSGKSEALRTRLAEVEAKLARLEGERKKLLRVAADIPVLPSAEEVRQRARQVLQNADYSQPGLGRLLRRLIPRIWVFPHRLWDGGYIQLRAEVEMNLAPLCGKNGDGFSPMLTTVEWVDLFEPPKRVKIRDQARVLRAQGMQFREIGDQLGELMSTVQLSLRLDAMARQAGSTDLYRRLLSPPDQGQLKRSLNPGYAFRPKPGFPAIPSHEGLRDSESRSMTVNPAA